MDPLVISLGLGCTLIFSQVERSMTTEAGEPKTGVFYKEVAVKDSKGRRVVASSRKDRGFSPGSAFRMGASPDGLFASYLVKERAAKHLVEDLAFISARECGPVRFVRVDTGAEVGAEGYRGWEPSLPHTVRVWSGTRTPAEGLPKDEARRANPAIPEDQ